MGKVLGIICEYNPFHNGHLYHLEQSKRLTGSNYTVAIMSGNFTQRGSTAIVDKWSRAEMALISGVDLVIELPFVFGTQAADIFTKGGCDILNALEVDAFVFGSEKEATDFLSYIDECLNDKLTLPEISSFA